MNGEQLKQLENDGLIIREYHKELPPRVDYSLTDFGKSLDVVFTSIVEWADTNLVVNEK